jgi:hypothetical protein
MYCNKFLKLYVFIGTVCCIMKQDLRFSEGYKIHVMVSWFMTACSEVVPLPHPEDGGSKVLWNTGILPHYYMVSWPRIPQLDSDIAKFLFLAANCYAWIIWFKSGLLLVHYLLCYGCGKYHILYIVICVRTKELVNFCLRELFFHHGKLGVKLTAHLHLVPRSKNAWSYTFTPTIHLNYLVLS